MEKNYIRKRGTCICQYCGIEFEKSLSEIKRNEKLNRPNFCTRTCVGKNNVKNLGERRGNIANFKGYRRTGDDYTKFRYHFRNIHKRKHNVDITIEDIKEQWELQKGICYFSGINLILCSYSKVHKNPIYCASIDRIDSKKGYIKGNIRWVSRAINWMKNDMSDDMVYELINLIVVNKKGS